MKRSNTTPPKIAIRIVASGIALFLIIVTAGNLIVLPRLVNRTEEAVTRRTGVAVDVGGSLWLPVRGLVLRRLTIDGTTESGSRYELRAGRLRVTGLAGTLRALLRGVSFDIPDFDLLTPDRFARELVSEAFGSEILPRRTVVHDVVIDAIHFDAIEITTHRSEGTVSLVASGNLDRRGGFTLSGLFDAASNRLAFALSVASVEASTLPGCIGGALDVTVGVESAEGDTLGIDGTWTARALVLDLQAISREAIGPIDARYSFDAIWYPADRSGTLTITDGDLVINGIEGTLLPEIGIAFDQPPTERSFARRLSEVRVTATLPQTPVDRILHAVPAAMTGRLDAALLEGTIALRLEATLPFDRLSDLTYRIDTDLSEFAVREIPAEIDVYKLNDSFTHTIDDGTGHVEVVAIPAAVEASMAWMLLHSEHSAGRIERRRVEHAAIAASRPPVRVRPRDTAGAAAIIGDSDPEYRYVRLDEMSPWIIRTVLTAEDGDFFFYGGINPVTLAGAIERNIEAGEILYGASTISMQLVKMLFLDQERIFSRKLQEAFLVYLMEHQVPVGKDRILELYLNLAEFGPGVFGVAHASRYYFDEDPANLDAGEAAWLASILPAPRVYHRYYEEGWISDGWFDRMIGLYDIMLERGRMTAAEYRSAVASRPRFTERD